MEQEIEAHREQYEADTLTEEMRKLEAATDGSQVEGIVTNVPEDPSGDRVTLTIETVLGEFTQSFEKPKPPLEEYELKRVADAYGQGLTDLSALEGETVTCEYDREADEFEVTPPKTRVERVRSMIRLRDEEDRQESDHSVLADNFLEYALVTVVWPFIVAISMSDLIGKPYDKIWYHYAHANLRWLFWSLLVSALLFVLVL